MRGCEGVREGVTGCVRGLTGMRGESEIASGPQESQSTIA